MKRFASGEAVQVQAEVGVAWERAAYVRNIGMRSRESYHEVELRRARLFNPFIGMETNAADARAVRTNRAIVPARRIRKLKP